MNETPPCQRKPSTPFTPQAKKPLPDAQTAKAAQISKSAKYITSSKVVLGIFFTCALTFAIAGSFLPLNGTDINGASFEMPSATHLLGTDNLGRDVCARLCHGGAQVLGIAAFTTVIAGVVGIIGGFIMAGTKIVGKVLMFIVDVFIALPSMLVMMVLIFGLGSGIATMACVTTAVAAPFIARYTQSIAQPVLASPYVQAAYLAGDSAITIAWREVLPTIVLPLANTLGILFISAMYLIASAAFLGFDPLGSSSDWGTMVEAGLKGLSLNPWASIAPAAALASITVPGNLLIDWLGKKGDR